MALVGKPIFGQNQEGKLESALAYWAIIFCASIYLIRAVGLVVLLVIVQSTRRDVPDHKTENALPISVASTRTFGGQSEVR